MGGLEAYHGGDLTAEIESSLTSPELDQVDQAALEALLSVDELVSSAADQVAGEIPVIRAVKAAFDLTRNVSTWLLLRKLVRFLSDVGETPLYARQEFAARLDGYERERIVGDLMLVLDRFDSMRKVDIQAALLKARILGELTSREYLDLTHATSSINVDAVDDLCAFYDPDHVVDEHGDDLDHANLQALYSFAILGLVGIDNSMLGTYGGGKQRITRIPLGQKYVDIISRH